MFILTNSVYPVVFFFFNLMIKKYIKVLLKLAVCFLFDINPKERFITVEIL